MNRRNVLETVAVAGVAALAGCVSSGDGADETTTATPTDTETPATGLSDTTFTVLGIQSGQQRDEATVGTDGTTVTVEGTIWGSDGCTTAALADAAYDVAADELTVAVATTDRESTATDGGVACTQALVEIDYRATAAFAGSLPGRVTVTHDHGDGPERVTTVSP